MIIKDGLKLDETESILYGYKGKQCPVILELPDTIEVIKANAFANHPELMKLKLGKKTRIIEDYAFSGTSIQSVSIPKTVEFIGTQAFTYEKGTNSWDKTVVPAEYKVAKANPFYYTDGRALYKRGEDELQLLIAFKTGIVEYQVEDGTVSIAEEAFSACSRLSSIGFPDTLKTIGEDAFKGTKIGVLKIPASVISLGKKELSYLRNNIKHDTYSGHYYTSTEIQVEEGNPVYKIENNLFTKKETNKTILLRSQDDKIENLVIPEGITHILRRTFYDHKKLTSMTLPSTLIEIGENAFEGCNGLDAIVLPENLKKVCKEAFAKCTKLRAITVKGMQTTFEKDVFLDCKQKVLSFRCEAGSEAEKFAKENGYTVLVNGAEGEQQQQFTYKITKSKKIVKLLGYVGQETEVTIPTEIEGYPVTDLHKDTFRNNKEIKKVIWNPALKEIPKETFYGCTSLTEVVIPEGVQTIGEKAFYNCTGLKEIFIPKTVQSIGIEAFTTAEYNYVWVKTNYLEKLIVDADNPYIIVDEAAWYEQDGTVLAGCWAKKCETYRIKEGTTEIKDKAFQAISIQHLFFPTDQVKFIADSIFMSYAYFGITFYVPKELEKEYKGKLTYGNNLVCY